MNRRPNRKRIVTEQQQVRNSSLHKVVLPHAAPGSADLLIKRQVKPAPGDLLDTNLLNNIVHSHRTSKNYLAHLGLSTVRRFQIDEFQKRYSSPSEAKKVLNNYCKEVGSFAIHNFDTVDVIGNVLPNGKRASFLVLLPDEVSRKELQDEHDDLVELMDVQTAVAYDPHLSLFKVFGYDQALEIADELRNGLCLPGPLALSRPTPLCVDL